MKITTIYRTDGSALASGDTLIDAIRAAGRNLYEADLKGANLKGANLSEAYLSGANLRWANLSRANLSGANLRDASLSGADLRWANLSGASLREADLSRADLQPIRDDVAMILALSPQEAPALLAPVKGADGSVRWAHNPDDEGDGQWNRKPNPSAASDSAVKLIELPQSDDEAAGCSPPSADAAPDGTSCVETVEPDGIIREEKE